jgi:glycosyltransferase involved in cell wall biosynthesis
VRIAHIVTLLSPDGAYGGPVRVAVNQLKALAELGHDVTLFSTYRGYDASPTVIDGVPVVAFPARTMVPGIGFAGLGSRRLSSEIRRRVADFDVVHVHVARDLVTLPAARAAQRAGVPVFLQTHGMIDRSSNPLAPPLDALLTRPAFRAASGIYFLTDRERDDLIAVGAPESKLRHLVNGVPDPSPLARVDSPVVDVLFLARLQARKRPTEFVRAAIALAPEFPDVTFSLVGPDEEEGDAVTRLIESSGYAERIRWEGALSPDLTLERMSRSAIYVLPSVDEPFPMSVLEAASLGLPVIVTDSCGLAPAIRAAKAGTVVDRTIEGLITGIRDLLNDVVLRGDAGFNARAMAQHGHSMLKVARALSDAYELATGVHSGSGAR